jgi:Fe-S-cluster containining protein
LVLEQAVRGSESGRQLLAGDFEAKLQIQASETKTAVTCQKACNHCCHYPVLVSVLEGVSLFRWLADQNLWRKDLKERVQEAHRRVWGLSPGVWMLSLIPCVLLTAEGLCGAYAARPFICRTTVSIGDPHYCHPHRFTEGAAIVSRRGIVEQLQEIENRLLKSARLTVIRLPIPTAILMGERLCKEGVEPEEISAQLFEEWSRNC